ncbi:MAG: glycosyltransferase family 4 protein [Candidatus Micrarchaeia archaeon]
MRIAFISDAVYPWNVGGIESLQFNEAMELAKVHEVHMFSFKWPGMSRNFKKYGINYNAWHSVTSATFYRHGRRSIREAIIFALSMFRLFGHRFDFIQANEFPILHIPIVWLYCKIYRCKLVIDVAEVWDKSYWTEYLGTLPGAIANAFASWVLRLGDHYIANSSATKSLMEKKGISASKIDIFSPVLSIDLNKRKSTEGDSKVIFAGRLIKEKRVDKFIKIIAKASKRHKGLKALIIGEGPEKENLKKMIKEMGLPNIEMRNFYKENEKYKLYNEIAASRVMLHMSEREGLSLIVLESLALGTPVLLPSYSPIPKEVKEMCVVENEKNIDAKLLEILEKNNKEYYIRNKSNLEAFQVSSTLDFYARLFSKLNR